MYKSNDATQSTAGITLTNPFDSVVGLMHVKIDLSADAFYVVGEDYQVILTAGTVDSVSVIGAVVADFSIENRSQQAVIATIASDVVLIYSDTTAIHSDTTIIASDVVIILSDTTQIASDVVLIYSDTTAIHSDTTIIASDVVIILSDTTQIASDVVLIYSDTTAIHSDTTIIASDVILIYSDTTAIHSDTTIIVSDTTQIASDVVIILSDTTQIASDVVIIASDVAALEADSIQKNAAYSNFEFLMVLTSDHVTPATGLTVTGQRSIDGGAFGAVSGTIAEVSNGIYQFDALAADTNGDVITWRFLSATADDTFVTFNTST